VIESSAVHLCGVWTSDALLPCEVVCQSGEEPFCLFRRMYATVDIGRDVEELKHGRGDKPLVGAVSRTSLSRRRAVRAEEFDLVAIRPAYAK